TRDTSRQIIHAAELDQLGLPAPMPQEAGDRKPHLGRRPQLRKKQERCCIPRTLRVNRGRPQHGLLRLTTTKKALDPQGARGPLSGPRRARSRLRLNSVSKTYVPSVNERKAKDADTTSSSWRPSSSREPSSSPYSPSSSLP